MLAIKHQIVVTPLITLIGLNYIDTELPITENLQLRSFYKLIIHVNKRTI